MSPKVKQFLWRCYTATLLVRDLLKSRHMLANNCCPRGCGLPETQEHALFSYPYVLPLWTDCGVEEVRQLLINVPLCEDLMN